MTNHTTIEQRVIRCISRSTGTPVSEITADSRLEVDLDLDSLDRLSVVMDVEDEFSVELPDDALENVETVRELVACGRYPWHGALGRFTAGDLIMATVLREVDRTDILSRYPNLEAYLDRCLARPAFGRAMEAQLKPFRENAPA